MATGTIKADSQVFQAVPVTLMVLFTPLVNAVAGGVLPRTIQTLLGPIPCIPTLAMCLGTTRVWGLDSLFVASEINSFDNLIISLEAVNFLRKAIAKPSFFSFA